MERQILRHNFYSHFEEENVLISAFHLPFANDFLVALHSTFPLSPPPKRHCEMQSSGNEKFNDSKFFWIHRL